MKKTYIKPEIGVSEFELEGLIATSLVVYNKDNTISTTDIEEGEVGQLTNKYNSPWSSTNWGE